MNCLKNLKAEMICTALLEKIWKLEAELHYLKKLRAEMHCLRKLKGEWVCINIRLIC